jgi:4-amino-4-deoxy-L-arabinose transferase-like glycosyltransferase
VTTLLDATPETASFLDEPYSIQRRRRLPRLVRGRSEDPTWVRPGLLSLLTGTALLYMCGLGSSGWANSFYSAAVQASTHSWKAFFFGSLDSGNSITVDKPPAALWVMDISARIFGVNSWSILVPEALMGVAAVGLLYLTVRRIFSPGAGLLAGAVMALTPVATLMFRFNNPDAMLVLLLVGAAYAVTRAVEAASTKWLLLAGLLVGTGFITKMMQAFLIVPAFGLAYLIAADTSLRRRILQLLAAAIAIVVASGWWVTIVSLWPASSRPYIGGSQNNSIINLIFGYNGLGRITGSETGSVTGTVWGKPGLLRMFSSDYGAQTAWLIPAALLLLVTMLGLTRRAPRTDPHRAQLVIWAGWLLGTGLTFSYMSGIIHPYYTVALAPATSALVGIGATSLWARREELLPRLVLAAAVGLTTWWAVQLLDRTPTWHVWLRVFVLFTGAAGLIGIAATPFLRRRLAPAVAAIALVASLAGPAAYSLATAANPHSGSLPKAGPQIVGGFRPGVAARPGGQHQGSGLFLAPTPSAAMVDLLTADTSRYRWVAATVGSQNAAGYQLGADAPVMAIGGFNGTDPSPTLAQFEGRVAEGQLHYFIRGDSGFGGPGGIDPTGPGTTTSSQITSWVETHYPAKTVGGTMLYDLTAAASPSAAASS